jgi:DNA-binding transcriptional ArsR family regulator
VLEGLLGNATAEKILLYLEQFEEGYARQIAEAFDGMAVSQVQRQLQRFEAAGVLVSQLKGRTRLYVWNPRYRFLDELRTLLRKALRALPEEERRRYFAKRRRPRRTGKPL